jgi:hypothetical protein
LGTEWRITEHDFAGRTISGHLVVIIHEAETTLCRPQRNPIGQSCGRKTRIRSPFGIQTHCSDAFWMKWREFPKKGMIP